MDGETRHRVLEVARRLAEARAEWQQHAAGLGVGHALADCVACRMARSLGFVGNAAPRLRVTLTRPQFEEVQGLLSVREAEPELVAWGSVEWKRGRQLPVLTVVDVAEALDDLRRRADYLRDEGARVGTPVAGANVARMLERLIGQIEAG